MSIAQQYSFVEVVPHSSPMALLDTLEHWEEDKLVASVTLNESSPFAESEGVPTWVGIEYMAQAIAAYSGIESRQSQQEVKIGFLVGSRRYTCNQEMFPLNQKLTIAVEQIVAGGNGLCVFECKITAINGLICEANLNVFQPDNADSFLLGDNND